MQLTAMKVGQILGLWIHQGNKMLKDHQSVCLTLRRQQSPSEANYQLRSTVLTPNAPSKLSNIFQHIFTT